VLLLGRVLGGVATSILYSVSAPPRNPPPIRPIPPSVQSFEAWMVSAHTKAGFEAQWLESTFTLTTFCSGVAAIVGGIIAAAANHMGGPVAPFDASALVLLAVLALVSQWSENKGSAEDSSATQGIGGALRTVGAAVKVLFSGECAAAHLRPPSHCKHPFALCR